MAKKRVIPVEEGDEQQAAIAKRERIRKLYYTRTEPPPIPGVDQDDTQVKPQANPDPPAKANTKALFGGW